MELIIHTPSPTTPDTPLTCGESAVYDYNDVPLPIPVVQDLFDHGTIVFNASHNINVTSIIVSIGEELEETFFNSNLIEFEHARKFQEYAFTVTAEDGVIAPFSCTIECPPPTQCLSFTYVFFVLTLH